MIKAHEWPKTCKHMWVVFKTLVGWWLCGTGDYNNPIGEFRSSPTSNSPAIPSRFFQALRAMKDSMEWRRRNLQEHLFLEARFWSCGFLSSFRFPWRLTAMTVMISWLLSSYYSWLLYEVLWSVTQGFSSVCQVMKHGDLLWYWDYLLVRFTQGIFGNDPFHH